MTYSVTGRLLRYWNMKGLDQAFEYDVFERILTSFDSIKYYLGNNLIKEQGSNGEYVEFVRSGKPIVAEKSAASTQFIGSDQFLSAVLVHNSEQLQHQTYAPYGSANITSRTGFTGEIKHSSAPFYLPGNGTRLYLPQYGLFSTIDSLSPFAGGGINPYLYCSGDPINLIDPSGHLATGVDLGLNIFAFIVDAIALGVTIATAGSTTALAAGVIASTFGLTSDTLGIAADSMSIQDQKKGTDRSQTISRLGIASSSFGAIAMVADLGAGVVTSIESTAKSYGKEASRAFKSAEQYRDKLARIPDRPRDSSKRTYLKNQAEESSKMGTTYYKKALEAADNSESTSKRIGKSFISTTTGADFDAFSDAANSTNSIVKRSMNGAWAATQIVGAGVGWTLLIEGTWSVDDDTDSEDMASGGLKSYVVQMMNDKYPIA